MTGARGSLLLRRLHLLVLALVTIVTAGLVTPGAVVSLVHPVSVAARTAQMHAVRWTTARRLAHPQASVARPATNHDADVVDLTDDDLDDDDSEQRGATRPSFTSDASSPSRGARLSRRPSWDLRGHPQFDRPRFRTGRGLLRGPPA